MTVQIMNNNAIGLAKAFFFFFSKGSLILCRTQLSLLTPAKSIVHLCWLSSLPARGGKLFHRSESFVVLFRPAGEAACQQAIDSRPGGSPENW